MEFGEVNFAGSKITIQRDVVRKACSEKSVLRRQEKMEKVQQAKNFCCFFSPN